MKNVADIVTAGATGEMGMGKDTGRRLYPTHDEIAQLAFCLYEASGRQDGHHVEDWLRAEQDSCSTTRSRNVLPNNHDALNASLNRKDNS
jgi:Protein of unknown function (DUF2934)